MKKTKKTTKKKKSVLPVILFVIMFLAGLSLLLYPTFSDWWNRTHQSHAIVEYHQIVNSLTEEERRVLWNAADEYNRKLYAMYRGANISEEELLSEYPTLLNLYGDGMMGVIEIPRIKVHLPVMHGTSEPVLQDAVGHVDSSSLPVGGENTHCVLSGHTGLPSARLFTDLEQMVVGDEFTLDVLGVRMTYQVDQILIVLPWEAEALDIRAGEDYCTLITCTPYGVNSHRLLVRGIHVSNSEAAAQNERPQTVSSSPQQTGQSVTETRWWLRDQKLPIYAAGGAVALLIVMLSLSSVFRRIRRKRGISAKNAETNTGINADKALEAEIEAELEEELGIGAYAGSKTNTDAVPENTNENTQ